MTTVIGFCSDQQFTLQQLQKMASLKCLPIGAFDVPHWVRQKVGVGRTAYLYMLEVREEEVEQRKECTVVAGEDVISVEIMEEAVPDPKVPNLRVGDFVRGYKTL